MYRQVCSLAVKVHILLVCAVYVYCLQAQHLISVCVLDILLRANAVLKNRKIASSRHVS